MFIAANWKMNLDKQSILEFSKPLHNFEFSLRSDLGSSFEVLSIAVDDRIFVSDITSFLADSHCSDV